MSLSGPIFCHNRKRAFTTKVIKAEIGPAKSQWNRWKMAENGSNGNNMLHALHMEIEKSDWGR
jgi:hypothetical protein